MIENSHYKVSGSGFWQFGNILKTIAESIFIYILLSILKRIWLSSSYYYSPFTVSMEVVSFNCWTRLLEADVVETGKARPIDILQSHSFLSCVIWFCNGFKPLSCGLGLESVLSTAWRRNPSDSTPRSQRCPSWTSWRTGRTQGTCSANKSVNIHQCYSIQVRGCFWNVLSNKWNKVLDWNMSSWDSAQILAGVVMMIKQAEL